MKKSLNPAPRSLNLDTETVRALDRGLLSQIAGGRRAAVSNMATCNCSTECPY